MRLPSLPLIAGRTRSTAVLAVSLTLLVAAVAGLRPAAAGATPPPVGATSAGVAALVPVTPLAVRGGGFRARTRTNRPLARNRPVTRNRNTGRTLRNVSRAILQALGIAFLLSFLFGVGAGGSPLGLLLLLAIVALFVLSRRRRRQLRY